MKQESIIIDTVGIVKFKKGTSRKDMELSVPHYPAKHDAHHIDEKRCFITYYKFRNKRDRERVIRWKEFCTDRPPESFNNDFSDVPKGF